MGKGNRTCSGHVLCSYNSITIKAQKPKKLTKPSLCHTWATVTLYVLEVEPHDSAQLNSSSPPTTPNISIPVLLKVLGLQHIVDMFSMAACTALRRSWLSEKQYGRLQQWLLGLGHLQILGRKKVLQCAFTPAKALKT